MILAHEVLTEQEIRKSRFITYLFPVSSPEEARERFRQIRKEHPDCTHVCTAFKIGSLAGSNDDGEPSGTAGKPMLSVLSGSEADQMAAAVVRYFGGTLLGKGGLVRAYSSSVSQALAAAEFLEVEELQVIRISFDYSLLGKVDGWISREAITVNRRDFDERVHYDLVVKESPDSTLAAIGSGQIEIRQLGTVTASHAL